MDRLALLRAGGTAAYVRSRIDEGGERIWRLHDFRGLSPSAVAQALSRLARDGLIRRLSKGVYYRGRQTPFGPSTPNPIITLQLGTAGTTTFASGTNAANQLNFTTQNSSRVEIATTASSLPRKLVGQTTIIHTRRPEAWSRLNETDASILDVLRNGGKWIEQRPGEAIKGMLKFLAADNRYERLIDVAASEPPRVRAMLGAFGELLRRPDEELKSLRESLNPFSRFEFGIFAGMPSAKNWQAKGTR